MKAVHQVLDRTIIDPAAIGKCALAVMTKAPRAGQVKTRLVPPLTHADAARLNICFLRDTASAITQACNGRARGIGVYTPVGAEADYIDVFPNEFALLVQRGEDFGERLLNAMQDLLAIGFAAVCLIDSDSPTVSAEIYAKAIDFLSGKNHESVVLGPSDDGGYYLIGLTKPYRRLFEEIDWSTERVLEQTTSRARELGLTLQLLPTCYDVDDRTSLERLHRELLDNNNPTEAASSTREFLRTLKL
jgi:rSAM/selenodomain-associated transferase 1